MENSPEGTPRTMSRSFFLRLAGLLGLSALTSSCDGEPADLPPATPTPDVRQPTTEEQARVAEVSKTIAAGPKAEAEARAEREALEKAISDEIDERGLRLERCGIRMVEFPNGIDKVGTLKDDMIEDKKGVLLKNFPDSYDDIGPKVGTLNWGTKVPEVILLVKLYNLMNGCPETWAVMRSWVPDRIGKEHAHLDREDPFVVGANKYYFYCMNDGK